MVFNFFRKKKQETKDASIVKEELKQQEIVKEEHKEEEKPFPKKTQQQMEQQIGDKQIIEVMKKVKDPEIDVDVWTLGLIYDIEEDEKLRITLTFTSPMCPFGPRILSDIKRGLEDQGYKEPVLDTVFNPLWEPSEELREMLGV